MKKHKILIIDDDVDICMLLKRFFERNNYDVKVAFKGAEGIEFLKNQKADIVLTDFRLPDKDGFQMIEAIKNVNPNIPVIVITGYSDVNQAVKVIRLGAYEYVTKPIYPEEILLLVQDALSKPKTDLVENEELNEGEGKEEKSETKLRESNENERFFLPTSSSAKNTQRLINLVAPTNMTVVILGESGTGKEVVARMIHEGSARKDKAFVPVDCGALPQELASSELFGHVKGAFTGATSDKKGSFEIANGGTLFLDEIGNLSYENQVKLLRVLQERVIRKVGSERDTPVDVRIVVATNEDLKIAMQKGTFREDIYYRINEFKIELKPLRESKEDLSGFVQFFLNNANNELDKFVEGLEEEVWEIFNEYSWPGNLRELKNAIKLSVLMAENKLISKSNLPIDILNLQSLSGNKNAHSDVNIDKKKSLNLKDVTAEAETAAILKVLSIANNNKTKAADILGVDRKTLYNKLNLYGLLEE
ncbi:sigma-54-dependent transcriptional regulator [Brumimicrobium oceani]|uniref:Sigma-54-dependent Fis family transcriptional regulator n=1 Tax=Brumimicrobium oceani TaxID=2100725 RepID=A0A2U2XGH7_9FLAO|nr:sigma-54 dependent transcriptional regulator [Brumimicrobium oceani]PWH86909.1 sigma-54-dependent Fis family transcriptional regulator [Brumimicrobium oceani]